VAFSGTCEKMRRLDELLQLEIGERIKSLLTLYPQQDFALLDVIHPAASKGAGLAAVAAEYNLTREEVLAAGDNLNDLEMLHYAGTGVVMGNAEASLRAVEKFHLTATNDESGVAVAIEKFVLQKQKTEHRIQNTEYGTQETAVRNQKLES
nr:HAD-IIB family hydrolase [Pyrinomonadaceae bacterium]